VCLPEGGEERLSVVSYLNSVTNEEYMYLFTHMYILQLELVT